MLVGWDIFERNDRLCLGLKFTDLIILWACISQTCLHVMYLYLDRSSWVESCNRRQSIDISAIVRKPLNN